jgi:hypothetical protein
MSESDAILISRIAVFPDTNLFLHYRPLEEFDWCSMLQVASVEIEIAPLVTRELEEQKTLHPVKRIRERAAASLKRLHAYLKEKRPRIVREGVSLNFLVTEPSAEFARIRGLNLQLGDDWLIGTIFLYAEQNPDTRCVLVTGDLSMTIKAHHFQVDVVEPDENLRLPPDTDPTESKLKQVQGELERYKSKEPVLDLRFTNGNKYVAFQIARQNFDWEPQIRTALEAVKGKYPLVETKAPNHLDGQGAQLTAAMRIAAELARSGRLGGDCNTRVKNYYGEYEKYLRESFGFKELAARTIKLQLLLANRGTCPAEDIHILLHFPNGFTLYDEEKPLEEPKEPQVPSKEVDWGLDPLAFAPIFHHNLSPALFDRSLPRIRKTNSYDVTFEYQKLQHTFVWTIAPLYVAFDSWESASSFSISYNVHAGNMITDLAGSWKIRCDY